LQRKKIKIFAMGSDFFNSSQIIYENSKIELNGSHTADYCRSYAGVCM
jgi:hypothetical protein